MGRIVVSQNITLDGVVEDPTGEEGFTYGGWFTELVGDNYDAWAELGLAEARGAAAFLMGRRTDEYLGPRWLGRSGEWADRLNSLPKYVVSSTVHEPKWSNSTVLSGDVIGEVTKLREELDGEIVVAGSRRLVHTLLEHGLVDELRLVVFPVVLGEGERLFGPTAGKTSLRLLDMRQLGDGLAYIAYEVVQR
jgi:dihydrofolate reductase